MRWYRFSIQEEKTEAVGEPVQEPAEKPPERVPQNVFQPKNRSEERRDMQRLFRQVNLKSPEILKTVERAPQVVYPLLQGIDEAVRKVGPNAMDRLKQNLEKNEYLPMLPPSGQVPQKGVAKAPVARQPQPRRRPRR
jgi:hypothetical protein